MKKAHEFVIQKWLNTELPISLNSLSGKVVMISAFQMLCPGCVGVGLPQAKNVFDSFSSSDLAVLGLHTVFEHHEAMKEESLKAFLYENRIHFPVGIDMPAKKGTIPETMEKYRMEGTPSTVLIDRDGNLRQLKFGHIPDLLLGAKLMALINEKHDLE